MMIQGDNMRHMLHNVNYALEALTALKTVMERDGMIAPRYFEEKFTTAERSVNSLRTQFMSVIATEEDSEVH